MNAAHINGAKEESSQFKLLAATYSVMAELLTTAKGKGFATKFYAPFFAQMEKQGFIPAFVYEAYQGRQLASSAEWGSENGVKLHEFQAWLSAYRWPAAK